MKLYNTLSRKKHTLTPLKKGRVSLYTCGPTVYHYSHIGNLRAYIFADILERSLTLEGYKVKRAMNITDVGHLTSDSDAGQDKLEAAAARSKKTVWDVARFYTKAFFDDCKKLNIKKPKKVVRATDAIPAQIKLIDTLFAKGYAYETKQAVYFDISKFKSYGKLSGQSLEEKLVAARGEVVSDPDKKHPADFSLWFKRVLHHKEHAMHWKSPWGDGFPGWHIECSAISSKYLGQPFDIHTGGVDHIGTHHENEIAQSEAATGKPLANVWMHNEFLVVDKQKMAKSSGSFVTLKEVHDKGFEPQSYRYLVLTAHYRSLLHFSWKSLEAAQHALHNLLDQINSPRNPKKGKSVDVYIKKFKSHISNDLDTPQALAIVWEAAKDQALGQKTIISFLKTADAVLGLDLVKSANKRAKEQALIPSSIKKLADERWSAKIAGNFEKADQIRLTLAKKGYTLQDQQGSYSIKKENAQ